jgi:hypothetical protein
MARMQSWGRKLRFALPVTARGSAPILRVLDGSADISVTALSDVRPDVRARYRNLRSGTTFSLADATRHRTVYMLSMLPRRMHREYVLRAIGSDRDVIVDERMGGSRKECDRVMALKAALRSP